MPNWCSDDLKVKGKKADLKKFKSFAKEGKMILSFNKFVPYPISFRKQDKLAKDIQSGKVCIVCKKDIKSHDKSCQKKMVKNMMNNKEIQIKDGYNSGGHDWCVNNWGTKWNLSDDTQLTESPRMLCYYFDTAWSPPFPTIIKMSKKFPKLKFELRYYEAGMSYQGVFKAENGEIIEDTQNDYHGRRGG